MPSRGAAVTPLIMGVLNASLDSLTGGVDAAGAAALAVEMVAGGAAVLDIGGQSLRTDQREITVAEELDRVEPVIEAVKEACPTTTISSDTYRAAVAARTLELGATLVNDPSGLIDPGMVEVVAASGADLVLAYSRATPKVRMTRAQLVDDVVADGIAFLSDRLEQLEVGGVDRRRVVVDIGPDLGKSPEQTIAVLRQAAAMRRALGGVRMLFAVSRKDFIGALVERTPARRGPGTFGALAAIDFRDGDMVRVHDVGGTADFFAVRAALLDGWEGELDLPEHVRYEAP
jgi:dihydropteroate synthase